MASSNLIKDELKEPFSAKSNNNLSEFSIIFWPLVFRSFNFAVSIVCSEILINLDEGTIGLEFDWLAEAKLVLTDELVKEMLKQKKINQNFDNKEFDEIETDRLEEIE